jgi:hypothetical protein
LTRATGTVSGAVTQSGNPIAGIKVTASSHTDSSYGAVTVTDEKGGFSFADAPVGGVDLTVRDGRNRIVLRAKAEVRHAGEVVTVQLEIAP